ncbi:MAG: hypothetical protein KGJ62_09340 [Armatimonadetes bacterium]|nr:hypothetical protein [Armatimonadota bacterium]MDE2207836.1 hypothetical protein [Armatimonadota bacterium]
MTTWRVLCTIYPNVNATVVGPNGRLHRVVSSYSEAWIQAVKSYIVDFEQTVARESLGRCRVGVATVVVDRTLSHFSGGPARYLPAASEVDPETAAYNTPRQFDMRAIVFNSGDGTNNLPEDIGGLGGGSVGGGTLWTPLWATTPSRANMLRVVGVLVHEWIHCLDGYVFGLNAYRIEGEHATGRAIWYPGGTWWRDAGSQPVGDWWGQLLGRRYTDGTLYWGYSEAVFASGTTLRRASPLPVQLLGPFNNTVWDKPPKLVWARVPATSFALEIYKSGAPDRSVYSRAVPAAPFTRPDATSGAGLVYEDLKTLGAISYQLPEHALTPGSYTWHVYAVNAGHRSVDGDELGFTIAPKLDPPTVKVARLEAAPPGSDPEPISVPASEPDPAIALRTPQSCTVGAEGAAIRLCSIVTTQNQIKRAWAEVTDPGGGVTVVNQHRHTPEPEETLWVGPYAVPANRSNEDEYYGVQFWAEDLTGKVTSSSTTSFRVAPKPADAQGAGLSATYFNSRNGTDPVLQRVDGPLDFFWSGSPAPGLGSENYSVLWQGYLMPPYTGHYVFSVHVDDCVRLFVGGMLILNHWIAQPPYDFQTSADLVGGKLTPIRIEYFNAQGVGAFTLRWSSDNVPEAIVPAANLYETRSGSQLEVQPSPLALEPRQPDGVLPAHGGRLLLGAVINPRKDLDHAWAQVTDWRGKQSRVSLVDRQWLGYPDDGANLALTGEYQVPAADSARSKRELQIVYVARDTQGRRVQSEPQRYLIPYPPPGAGQAPLRAPAFHTNAPQLPP